MIEILVQSNVFEKMILLKFNERNMKELKEKRKIEFFIDLMFLDYEQIMTLQSTNNDMTTKFCWESVNQYQQKT